jgi:regulator-associated protein of mTOR
VTRGQSLFSQTTAEEDNNEADDEAGFGSQPLAGRRNATGLNLSSFLYGSPQSLKRSGSIVGMPVGTPPKGLPDNTGGFATSRAQQTSSSLKFDLVEDDVCPESMFYQWKKVEFADRSVRTGERQRLDLLSDIGAIAKYRSVRNSVVQQKGQLLKDSFAVLAQTQKRSSDSPYGTDIPSDIDKDIEARKEATHLKQISALQNTTSRGSTSLLRFHPYEPSLVVCGSSDITCWNAETSDRMVSFSNENPRNTRITAASWINETTTSLFLTGCNDGSVRVWDGILEPNDEMSTEKPTLISSFFAAPDISLDKGKTGLILEYQSCGGQLIAGGSTKQIHCWDIGSEKCRNSFDTGSDAMLTTLESAWKHSYRDGYSGFGPYIVIAGFSNGALKLYDTRARNGAPSMNFADTRNIAAKRRIKHSEFNEHSSWIIDVSFTGFAGRHEVSIVNS